MNFIDTNGVSNIFDRGIRVSEIYYLAPDVVEETEMTSMIHNQKLPEQIQNIIVSGLFDDGFYVDFYNRMLNKFGGRSFYNMTGFGDISIISTIHTVLKVFAKQEAEELFPQTQPIVVFTDDASLTAKILNEFLGQEVSVRETTSII